MSTQFIDTAQFDYISKKDYESIAGPDWPSFDSFLSRINVPDFVYRELTDMLTPPKKFENPSFCILPFYGLEYPGNTPCCLISSGADVESIKKEMISGSRPAACKKCWNLEDAGVKSDRLLKNETLDFYLDRNIEDLYQECIAGDTAVIHYKIDTSNICNATCVTCNSNLSSAWGKLEKSNSVREFKIWKKNSKDVDNVIDYATAKSIGFRGGEPLLSKTNFYILEQLIAVGNTDCFISFTTNGSINLSATQQQIIAKFSKINFCFSIDGIGPVFEYLRYPLKFNQLLKNIQYCRENNIIVSASYTVSNLNVLYHSETVAWFLKNQISYQINLVYDPVYFRSSVLTTKVKEKILKQQPTDEMHQFLYGSHHTDYYYDTFRKNIEQQDRWKNINIHQYLPELMLLLDQ
jgi:hypothetical protein